ncbi:MAG: glutamate ligase domain-containing protein [Merdibacter sp.]
MRRTFPVRSSILDETSDVDLYCRDGKVWLHDTMLFSIDTLKIVGDYNVCNAMIAACMAYRMGVSIADIQAAAASFTSVEHRLEYIGEANGVRFYNDSKATNTHAAAAALSSFASNIILLAGGHDKGIPFDDLKRFDDRVKLCVPLKPGRSLRMSLQIASAVLR